MKKVGILICLLLCAASVYAEQYVVLTTEDLKNYVDEIVEYRSNDYNVSILLYEDEMNIISELQTIYKNESGYLLIVGLNDEVPAFNEPKTYTYYSGGKDRSYTIKYNGDFDYSDLNADFIADIKVGRFPSNNETQIKNIIRKTILFEQHNKFEDKKVLLWGGPQQTVPKLNGFQTMSFLNKFVLPIYQQQNWEISTVYCYDLNSSANRSVYDPENGKCFTMNQQAEKRIKENQTVVVFRGHGGKELNAFCRGVESKQAFNTDPFIIYSESCNNINVGNDVYSDYFSNNIINQKHGAVAFIGSNTLTGEAVMPYRLSEYLFVSETLGEAFLEAKKNPKVHSKITMHHFDLLGDPALKLKYEEAVIESKEPSLVLQQKLLDFKNRIEEYKQKIDQLEKEIDAELIKESERINEENQ